MITSAAILKEARSMLSNPDAWVQNMYFGHRDNTGVVEGRSIDYRGNDANCFCVVGATIKARSRVHDQDQDDTSPALVARAAQSALRILDDVAVDRGAKSAMNYNDTNTTTYDQIISLLDEAIAEADRQAAADRGVSAPAGS